jgi:hypothetical protein
MNQSETSGGDDNRRWFGGRRGKPRILNFAKKRELFLRLNN